MTKSRTKRPSVRDLELRDKRVDQVTYLSTRLVLCTLAADEPFARLAPSPSIWALPAVAASPGSVKFGQKAVLVRTALVRVDVVDDLDIFAAGLFTLLEVSRVVGPAAEVLPEPATHG